MKSLKTYLSIILVSLHIILGLFATGYLTEFMTTHSTLNFILGGIAIMLIYFSIFAHLNYITKTNKNEKL